MAGTGRKVWAADEVLAAADLQSYIQDQVVFVYANASARASGILSPSEGMISYLQDTDLLYTFNGSSWVEVAPNVGTAGTYTKVTTDAKGRVSSGTTLDATDIPALDSSKVTTGTFDLASRTTGTMDITSRTSGTLPVSRGGTGATSLTGYIFGNGTGAFTALNEIPGAAIGGSNINIPFNGITAYTGSFTNSLYAANTYNQTNTGRAVYIASNGLFGIGSSSARFKDNIVDADIDVDAVLRMRVRNFIYKPDRIESDGSVQVGVIAEELVALGLEQFVFFGDDGKPDGVAYEKLALALIPLVQLQAEKMDSIEDRLSKLESR